MVNYGEKIYIKARDLMQFNKFTKKFLFKLRVITLLQNYTIKYLFPI